MVGHNWQSFLRGAWTQLHQTWPGHKAIIATLQFCFRIRISCCILQSERSKLSDVENDAKFRTFWPQWKLGDAWVRSLYQLRPNLRSNFDGHPLRGCWARWIDKKRKKESSWLKLKAFRTKHGRNFVNSWSICKILSLLQRALNFQQNCIITHHTLSMLLHYLGKLKNQEFFYFSCT